MPKPNGANGATKGELGETLLDVKNLVMHFPLTQGIIIQRKVGAVQAVDDVSFAIRRGEILGLVGESGSGKSTVARMLLRLVEPTAGEVRYERRDLLAATPQQMRAMPNLQVAFGETMRFAFLQLATDERSPSPPLRDSRVRRAIMHAIDRETMDKAIVGEGSRVLHVLCFPSQFGCTACRTTPMIRARPSSCWPRRAIPTASR